jgi:hypothetical protein
MHEEHPMPPGPDDQLERLMAAEEVAIHDNGFTRRVMDNAGAVDKAIMWRKTAIYGAGFAGFGFALGGIVELTPHLPNIAGWFDSAVSAMSAARVEEAVIGASDATQLAIVAVLAGITFLVTAVTLQNR